MTNNQHVVLICPLDWGLGHASRMIPLVDRFMACGYKVMLGGAGKSGELLRTTFPQLHFISIPSPVIHYSGKGLWLIPSLIWQLPNIIFSIIREHYLIKKIVETHRVKILVSDNRYGLFCRKAYSIFITHQISPVLPASLRWAEYPLYLIIRAIILQYNVCWIPDFADPLQNLSGDLSHRFKLPENARYIGILSRFSSAYRRKKVTSPTVYELVIILSGPEPQLSIINELMIRQASAISNKTLLISGFRETPDTLPQTDHLQLTIMSHLESDQFYQAMIHADLIVCRSGYSGIMDLVALGKNALLVPTPGQPEQQYLATYLSDKGWFSYTMQHELDLGRLMKNKLSSSCIRFSVDGPEKIPISLLENDEHC